MKIKNGGNDVGLHHLYLTSIVSRHSGGWTWHESPPLLSILCHIFHDIQLPHVFFHNLTPGLLAFYLPPPAPSHSYVILIPTFYMTKPSQPHFSWCWW